MDKQRRTPRHSPAAARGLRQIVSTVFPLRFSATVHIPSNQPLTQPVSFPHRLPLWDWSRGYLIVQVCFVIAHQLSQECFPSLLSLSLLADRSLETIGITIPILPSLCRPSLIPSSRLSLGLCSGPFVTCEWRTDKWMKPARMDLVRYMSLKHPNPTGR